MAFTCDLAITAWQIVGIVAIGFALAVFLMWLWFVVLGKGDWS